jgi:putative PIN family toxin of toxin-antitoxin system
MKVLIDANLVISFLLKGKGSSDPIRLLFELILSSRFELVVPQDLLDEVRAKALSKPFLRDRIVPAELNWLCDLLIEGSTLISKLSGDLESITRDSKDDYLIAAALIGDVDFLVSGDKDLLVLRDHLDRPRIMSPADFVAEFGEPAT